MIHQKDLDRVFTQPAAAARGAARHHIIYWLLLLFTVTRNRGTFTLSMLAFERIVLAVALFSGARSFSPARPLLFRQHQVTRTSRLYSTSTDPAEMKLREIQAELKDMGVSYVDCFDRESLTRRLKEARNGEIPVNVPKEKLEASPKAEPAASSPSKTTAEPRPTSSVPPPSSFDCGETLKELRSLRVKELRTELAKRNIRWGNMVEKEDLVQALLKAREATSNFSSSGALSPGKVADINGDTLKTELSTPASTPMLLDVYAVWCGPCQMMAPQLQAAAEELGDSVRVAKIDSDKYPDWASQLRVGGLPTVIVFDGSGNEIERVEGALMKGGLVQLARKHM